ncbi:unnamed protein product, partial [Orchesella dallaii]
LQVLAAGHELVTIALYIELFFQSYLSCFSTPSEVGLLDLPHPNRQAIVKVSDKRVQQGLI